MQIKVGEESKMAKDQDFEKDFVRLKNVSKIYRTESGELFSCCAPTLEQCRERRDKWLSSQQ